MPYLGRTPFLQVRDRWCRSNHRVSMPYLGRTPFLRCTLTDPHIMNYVCQCPISGALHFYRDNRLQWRYPRTVSMPYLGRTPFLQTGRISGKIKGYCVNALSRAHSISTKELRYLKIGYGGVNALSRAHSISTIQYTLYDIQTALCQCPISGALHFYCVIPCKNL